MSDSMQPRVPYAVSPPRYSVSHQMVTTAFELPNSAKDEGTIDEEIEQVRKRGLPPL